MRVTPLREAGDSLPAMRLSSSTFSTEGSLLSEELICFSLNHLYIFQACKFLPYVGATVNLFHNILLVTPSIPPHGEKLRLEGGAPFC